MGDIESEVAATPHNDHYFRSWLPFILSTSLTLIGVGYLLLAVLGKVGANWFGTTEAIVLGCILLLNAYLLQRIERLETSDKGADLRVLEAQREQGRQRAEIKFLRSFISSYVTKEELGNLLRLTGKMTSVYSNPDDWHHEIFVDQLRRLRLLGLIRMQKGKVIDDVPKNGDLNEYCRITERGQEYLKLREEVEAQEQESV